RWAPPWRWAFPRRVRVRRHRPTTVLVGLWLSLLSLLRRLSRPSELWLRSRLQLLRQLSGLWFEAQRQRQADLVLLLRPGWLLSICGTLQHRMGLRSRLCNKP